MTCEYVEREMAQGDYDRLLPVAQKVDRLISQHTIQPFRARVMAWLEQDSQAGGCQMAWRERRLKYARMTRLTCLLALGHVPTYATAGSLSVEWFRHETANDLSSYYGALTYFPDDLLSNTEPKRPQPLPIPDGRDATIDEKFVALSALRDALERGERVVPETEDDQQPLARTPALSYYFLMRKVVTLRASDEPKLTLWLEDVVKQLNSDKRGKASAPATKKAGRKVGALTKRRAAFAKKLRGQNKPLTWPEIYIRYAAKYPNDTKASADVLRLLFSARASNQVVC